MKASLQDEMIAKAESFPGIKAGIARLEDILNAPSYQVVPEQAWSPRFSDEGNVIEWPPGAATVLVLGMSHPEDDLRLDWWAAGNTRGNRRLMAFSDSLKQWLQEAHGLRAVPLPYHLERGGLFLKDAAVLAGLGIIGKSNLLLNPEWGPRIRLRSILIEGEVEPSTMLEGFSPCDSCHEPCQAACPQNAFAAAAYSRPDCVAQMNTDFAARRPDDEVDSDGTSGPVIRYCRACEFACPVGT